MMTFLYFAAAFFLLCVAVFAWMVRDGPIGAKAIGVVFLICFSNIAYLILSTFNLSTLAAITAILVTWVLGGFWPEILGFFPQSRQKGPH